VTSVNAPWHAVPQVSVFVLLYTSAASKLSTWPSLSESAVMLILPRHVMRDEMMTCPVAEKRMRSRLTTLPEYHQISPDRPH